MADNQSLVAPMPTTDENGQLNYTPIQGISVNGEYYDQGGSPLIRGYQDRNGNIWESTPTIIDDYGTWSTPKLLLSSEVANDPIIQSLGLVKLDPNQAKQLYDLKQSNPTEYYNQVAKGLEDNIYTAWKFNNADNPATDAAKKQLEAIKDINPQAYYTAKLTDLGRSVGWQTGQNRNDRNASTIQQIQALIPEAQKAGLSSDQINSLVGGSVNQANAENQTRIANEASSGNFWGQNLIGALKVGALALGAGGLDAALSAGATAGTEAGMNGALQGYLGTTGGAYVPAEGFSAALPSAFGAAEAVPFELPDGTMGSIQGGNILDASGNVVAKGGVDLSLADVASYANKARQGFGVANTLAKLLGGGAGGKTGTTGITGTSGINPQQLASLLGGGGQQTNSFIGQIKGNQNPFLFTPPGQTQAAQGTYDVSGSNLANALRKA